MNSIIYALHLGKTFPHKIMDLGESSALKRTKSALAGCVAEGNSLKKWKKNHADTHEQLGAFTGFRTYRNTSEFCGGENTR